MKIEKVIKALEKVGLKVEKKVHHKFEDGTCKFYYSCKSANRRASWYEHPNDDGKVDFVHIQPLNYDDHGRADNSTGTFWDTVKWVVKIMSKD